MPRKQVERSPSSGDAAHQHDKQSFDPFASFIKERPSEKPRSHMTASEKVEDGGIEHRARARMTAQCKRWNHSPSRMLSAQRKSFGGGKEKLRRGGDSVQGPDAGALRVQTRRSPRFSSHLRWPLSGPS